MSINSVCISGNLTRDPDLRTTASGSNILNFGVAVNDRVKNPQTGEWEDYPNFIDCVLFGNRATSLSGIMRKGMKVAVSGRLRYSSWEKDGQRRSKVEVIANDVELPPRGQQQQATQAQQGYFQGVQPIPAQQPVQPAAQMPVQSQTVAVQQQPQQQYQQQYQQQPQQQDMWDSEIPF